MATKTINARTAVNMPRLRAKIPDIIVEPGNVQVTMDTKDLSAAVLELGKLLAQQGAAMQLLAQQQQAILSAINKQNEYLAKMPSKAPVVNIPKRPSAFRVMLEKDEGETTGMYVEAVRTN